MAYHPIYIDLKKYPILIVGGGPLAAQKAGPLIKNEANITVVSPASLPTFHQWHRSKKVKLIQRKYRPTDLKGKRLVIAGTNDPKLNTTIYHHARKKGITVNVADKPDYCDFISPALVQKGPLQIAISTGGASPAMARYLREQFEKELPPSLFDLVSVFQKFRPRLLKLDKQKKKLFLQHILSPRFMTQIKKKSRREIERAFIARLRK